MKRLRKFGNDLVKTAWSHDWFDWLIYGVFVFLGVVGGAVIDILWKEFEQ